MYKTVTGLAAPSATFATIAVLPKVDVSPVTMFAVVLALAMTVWAYLYLLRARGKMTHVKS